MASSSKVYITLVLEPERTDGEVHLNDLVAAVRIQAVGKPIYIQDHSKSTDTGIWITQRYRVSEVYLGAARRNKTKTK